jgi:hypothetical protein
VITEATPGESFSSGGGRRNEAELRQDLDLIEILAL